MFEDLFNLIAGMEVAVSTGGRRHRGIATSVGEGGGWLGLIDPDDRNASVPFVVIAVARIDTVETQE